MPLGLPLRTMKDTIDLDTMPFVEVAPFQSLATSPASTSRSTSGSIEKDTTSAFRPPSTARLCSPEAPKELLNATSLPASVLRNAGMISS